MIIIMIMMISIFTIIVIINVNNSIITIICTAKRSKRIASVGSSGRWRLRMWCLIIMGFTLSYTYVLPNMGSQNYYHRTPHPQTPHP